jgi:hypothetical protein
VLSLLQSRRCSNDVLNVEIMKCSMLIWYFIHRTIHPVTGMNNLLNHIPHIWIFVWLIEDEGDKIIQYALKGNLASTVERRSKVKRNDHSLHTIFKINYKLTPCQPTANNTWRCIDHYYPEAVRCRCLLVDNVFGVLRPPPGWAAPHNAYQWVQLLQHRTMMWLHGMQLKIIIQKKENGMVVDEISWLRLKFLLEELIHCEFFPFNSRGK